MSRVGGQALRRLWLQAWVRYSLVLALGLASGMAIGLVLAQRPWVLLARLWRAAPDQPPFDALLQ
ncbi:MAG: hypothetical protein IRY86_08530 [Thermorudis peleae]|nr:hypothetical protein [Thermorudis peleae]